MFECYFVYRLCIGIADLITDVGQLLVTLLICFMGHYFGKSGQLGALDWS
jgi:hypothetical protein